MSGMNIDITAITAILMGGLLLLVPLAGATLRYGVAPFFAALAELRAAGSTAGSTSESAGALTRRLEAIEERIRDLEVDSEVRAGGRKSVA